MNTSVATAKWSHQDQHSGIADWCGHYWNTRGTPSRVRVIETLRGLPPWKTLVELGCNAGPMLSDIQAAFPAAALTGLDINQAAIRAGQQHLPDVTFLCTDFMSWFPQQAAQSFDVLLTHYTFAYVSPTDLPAVLAQCQRVAFWLVLAEPAVSPSMPSGKLVRNYPEWWHNYAKILLHQGAPKVSVSPVEDSSVNHICLAQTSGS